MRTPSNPPHSIQGRLASLGEGGDHCLRSATASVRLADSCHSSSLAGGASALAGRVVALATTDQLATAIALVELDGVARRVVICPPTLPARDLSFVAAVAGVEAVVSDDASLLLSSGVRLVRGGAALTPIVQTPVPHIETEWVLLTSGTTGTPKLLVHTLARLTASIGDGPAGDVLWSTFYDIRRYGGLQILLRAALGKRSCVLSSPDENIDDFLVRLGQHNVTHISGTPSHWRTVLMSPAARAIAPRYIRLSGEIADQPILKALSAFYTRSAVSHVFASTEVGVVFEVTDGFAGFPANLVGVRGGVEMKVRGGSLRIRSDGTALRYLGDDAVRLEDGDRFIDTQDMVERREHRYYFLGRRTGVINIGGLKVYPEEVEGVINRHPAVQVSRVRPKSSPITGSLVAAEVVLKHELATTKCLADCKGEILRLCHANLAAYKVPATIRIVPALDVAASGKLERH